ncbi:hypothetical protein H1C71_028491, partial [Ictidomys tridecemlineatus]
ELWAEGLDGGDGAPEKQGSAELGQGRSPRVCEVAQGAVGGLQASGRSAQVREHVVPSRLRLSPSCPSSPHAPVLLSRVGSHWLSAQEPHVKVRRALQPGLL